MSVKAAIISHAAALITNENVASVRRGLFEIARKVRVQHHRIHFYFRVDDPYSFLLLQVLQSIPHNPTLEIDITVVPSPMDSVAPEREKLAHYGLRDCQLIAPHLGLIFDDNYQLPQTAVVEKANRIVINGPRNRMSIEDLFNISYALWRADEDALNDLARRYGMASVEQTKQCLADNYQQLLKMGHYNSAMLYYGGEWYWGVDRWHYLANRLAEFGISMPSLRDFGSISSVGFQPKNANGMVDDTEILKFYYSFRSPYSYVAIDRVFQLARKLGIGVEIKPVMPMVMRGLPVPRSKKMYIFKDAAREAHLHGVPFGKACDPLGKGIEKCIALFFYAQGEGKAEAFITRVGKAVWAEGKNINQAGILQQLLADIGLSWEVGQTWFQAPDKVNVWREEIKANTAALNHQGMWGVPAFCIGRKGFWGQDRIALIETLVEQCSASNRTDLAKAD